MARVYPAAGYPIVLPVPFVPGASVVPEDAYFYPHLRLTPAPDGVQREFLSPLPFLRTDNAPEVVYRNGVRVDPSAYTLSSTRNDGALTVVTFTAAPLPDDLLVLDAYVLRP